MFESNEYGRLFPVFVGLRREAVSKHFNQDIKTTVNSLINGHAN